GRTLATTPGSGPALYIYLGAVSPHSLTQGLECGAAGRGAALPTPSLAAAGRARGKAGVGREAGLTQHLAEEQLLQVSQHGHHKLGVHLEEGALLLALGRGHGPGALLRLGFAREQLVVRLAVVAHGRLGSLAERLDLGVGAARDPARLPQAGRERGQGGLGAAGRAALGLEERVLGLGQRLGHQRSLAAFGPRLAQALGRLGHVVAPLGLIELHLFLGVREEREVGERLLLAQVGGRRPAGDSAVHAAGFEDLQLRRAGLGHAAAAGRLGALGQHASAVRRRRLPARAPRLVRALVAAAAAQLHLGLHALDAAAQHSAREERMDDPRVCRHRGRGGGGAGRRRRGGERREGGEKGRQKPRSKGRGRRRERGRGRRRAEGAGERNARKGAGEKERARKPRSDGAGSEEKGRGGKNTNQNLKINQRRTEAPQLASAPRCPAPGSRPPSRPPVGPADRAPAASESRGCGQRLRAQEGGGGDGGGADEEGRSVRQRRRWGRESISGAGGGGICS
uniref:Uncharacterized protein n=1 Tax=Sus scrofa TaxID=9823 RepID=A0A4X1SGY4_PIG